MMASNRKSLKQYLQNRVIILRSIVSFFMRCYSESNVLYNSCLVSQNLLAFYQSFLLLLQQVHLMSEKNEHSIDDYEILSQIGRGTFGDIFLVREVAIGKVFAMKVVKKKKIVKKKLIQKQNKLKYIFTERNLLIELNHPFIIRVIYTFQNCDTFYFILEHCPGGELFNLLEIKQTFSEEQAKFYISQIVIALNYLHSKDIVYRDLKPENIMIDRQGFIKLSDFGLSKKLKPREENVFSIMGMPEYTAPEILLKRDCTKAVDFWCLGSLLLEMITGFPPFYSENLNELYDSIKSEPFAIDEEQKLSSDCVNLLQGFLQKDPNLRLGMNGIEEIMLHPWFQGISWDAVETCKYKPPFVPILKNDEDTTYFSASITSSSLESVRSYAAVSSRGSHLDKTKYFAGFDYNPDEDIQALIQ